MGRSACRRPRRLWQLIALVALPCGVFIGVGATRPLSARAGGSGSDLGPNGQHRRPFYIYAHNPNEVDNGADDVGAALGAGANALEPDVMTFAPTAKFDGTLVNSTAGPSGMFIYHDDTTTPARMPQTLERWLGVDSATNCGDTTGNWRLSVAARIVCDGANVAAIAFDVKSPTAASQSSASGPPDAGVRMHAAVDKFRQTLTDLRVPSSRQPWIIYSVGDAVDANNLFQTAFTSLLTSREGIMVDGGSDAPDSTTRFLLSKFDAAHVGSAQIGYGAGSIAFDSGFAPSVLPNIEQASAQNLGFDQAGIGRSIAIPYAFTVNTASDMNRIIDGGADGEIPDAGLDVPSKAVTVDHIKTLSQIVQGRTDVFLATAADNPFDNQKTEGYALRIHTTDELNAGTDAKLTFTLTGCRASSSLTISTAIQREFERDDVNRVTIPSEDLGALRSLTIHNDGAGTAPGWNFDDVQLASGRYGIAAGSVPLSGGDPGIDGGQSITIPLAGQGSTNCDATVTGTGQYGGAKSFAYTGNPPVGVSLTGTATCTTADGGKALGGLLPGSYTIDAASCSGVTGSSTHDSFTPTYRGGTFKVVPRPLTISADTGFTSYGDAIPTTYAPIYTGPPGVSSAFVNGDTSASLTGTLSFDTAATTASPPGRYPVRLSGLSSDRYDITFADAVLQIGAAPLTVTAPSASRVYGAADPTFTATLSGFKNGETLPTSGVTGNASCTSNASIASTVAGSPYPITCTVGTLSGDGRYSFGFGSQPFVAGKLTITKNTTSTGLSSSANPAVFGQPVTLTATVANDPGAELATGPVTFTEGTTTLGSATLQNDGRGNAVAILTTRPLSAGSHAITVGYGGDPNFLASSLLFTEVVDKAALTVTADNKTRPYGQANPPFTASYAGFVNGDGPASLGGTLAFATPATAASGLGGYAITPSGLTSANYTITFTAGTLSVTKAALTVTADNKTRPYGQPNPALTYKVAGFVNGDQAAVVSGTAALSTAAVPSSGVGNYSITVAQGTLAAANYSFTPVNGTLTVSRATTTLVATPAEARLVPPHIYFPMVSARLTIGSPAVPVSGQTIRFMVGSTVVCVATTDANGNASCTGSVTAQLGVILHGGYDAVFGGDPNLLPSQSHGPLFSL
ncbi:MAG TPA: MBG domain-containing protein [Acidimicrobiales bacterium]|nr:MBG domain-containing protein [Acidimicrobiales bacterium]